MAVTTDQGVPDAEARARLQARAGASWFWWIAALSLVNTVLAHSGSSVNFLMGLAYTQAVDSVAGDFIQGGADALAIGAIATGLDVAIAGLFVLLGVLAHRGKPWAYLAGIALYAGDALVFAAFGAWPNVAFHALAGFFVVRGFIALRSLPPRARP